MCEKFSIQVFYDLNNGTAIRTSKFYPLVALPIASRGETPRLVVRNPFNIYFLQKIVELGSGLYLLTYFLTGPYSQKRCLAHPLPTYRPSLDHWNLRIHNLLPNPSFFLFFLIKMKIKGENDFFLFWCS